MGKFETDIFWHWPRQEADFKSKKSEVFKKLSLAGNETKFSVSFTIPLQYFHVDYFSKRKLQDLVKWLLPEFSTKMTIWHQEYLGEKCRKCTGIFSRGGDRKTWVQ